MMALYIAWIIVPLVVMELFSNCSLNHLIKIANQNLQLAI